VIPSIRWQWLAPTAMVIAAGAAALGPAGPDALVPFKAATVAAADSVYVALVVDLGQGYGGSPRVVSGCVRVPPGKSGYDALTAFTQQMNWAPPSYNNAGLLCTIDGYPQSGCGQVVASGYDYWSYWHGDPGTWTYSSEGASRTMQTGDVEGWRFENPGHGNPTDPPPAAAPDFASICASNVTSTTSAPTTVTPTTIATTNTAPTGSNPAGPTGTSPPGSNPSSTTSGSGQAPTNPGQPVPGSGSRSPTTTRPTGSGGSTAHTGHSGSQPPRTDALGRGVSDQHKSGGSVPLVVGGFIVVILGCGALYRWRRHPGAP
jgi:hypothetical protein